MPTTPLPVDYQQVFRALPDALLLMDPHATILDNTDAHVAVSLKARAEVVGRPLFEAFPSVDQNQGDIMEASHAHVRQHLEPHTMPLIRYDLERPAEQGGGFEEFYWQATHYPILNAQGQLQYILQRTQNVTEQLRAARAAAEAQQKLADEQARTLFILENLPVLIWTTTPDGRADYFNPRWLAFTGHDLAEEIGEHWLESLHPDDRARVAELWQQRLATGELFQAEYRLRCADGSYRWILARAAPRRADDGTITMWVGGATDIHDQKQMVQELLETNEQQAALSEQAYHNYQQAQQQRQTMYSLLMKAPACIGIMRGPEHRFEFANEGLVSLARHIEIVGRTAEEVFPEIKGQGVIDILDGVYQTGESYRGRERLIRLDKGDGSGELRDAYFTFFYQRFEENGQAAGITVFASEVTELVNLRRALDAR
ncbi:MAG TPA: PAS domain-containing protein [Hymenobacter sp.]|uniref:PAS domain-containing protein n=1 Tax=Hymenobacter sp. TaxID=1898978 RepID=UPI002D7EED8C|nr:PAS domain-containing protein [Hymenobacter sp.]HET9502103.1 PAS domain-containing protein [Hymenobacter sp.]